MTIERRNVVCLVLLEVFWCFGAAFIGGDILAGLIHSQGGGPLALAVVTICGSVLTAAPQLLVPFLEQRITQPIRGAAWSQASIILGFVGIAVALAMLKTPALILGVIVGAQMIIGLGNAVCAPYYQRARMRLFPPQARSASYSTVLFASNASAMLGAVWCVSVLNTGGAPTQQKYLICYLVATGMAVLSTGCYLFMRDPNPVAPPPTDRRSLASFGGEYVELLRRDRTLRWFLICECFAWLGTIGGTFLTFSAVQRFGEDIAAQCNLARIAAALAAVPVAHYLETRHGSRAPMLAHYVCLIAALVGMLTAATPALAIVAVGLCGVGMTCRVSYMFHFVAALTHDAQRTRYFALSNAIGAPFSLVCPLIGTWLLTISGNNYAAPFGVAMVALGIGLVLVWRRLDDPTGDDEQRVVARVTLKRLSS